MFQQIIPKVENSIRYFVIIIIKRSCLVVLTSILTPIVILSWMIEFGHLISINSNGQFYPQLKCPNRRIFTLQLSMKWDLSLEFSSIKYSVFHFFSAWWNMDSWWCCRRFTVVWWKFSSRRKTYDNVIHNAYSSIQFKWNNLEFSAKCSSQSSLSYRTTRITSTTSCATTICRTCSLSKISSVNSVFKNRCEILNMNDGDTETILSLISFLFFSLFNVSNIPCRCSVVRAFFFQWRYHQIYSDLLRKKVTRETIK